MPKESSIYAALGRRVREIRKSLGMTQERLSFKSGISISFLSHIERGTKKCSLETVEKLAAALEVPVEGLFSLPGKPVTYLQNQESLLARRLEGLIREKGDGFGDLVWKYADYLAGHNKKSRKAKTSKR